MITLENIDHSSMIAINSKEKQLNLLLYGIIGVILISGICYIILKNEK